MDKGEKPHPFFSLLFYLLQLSTGSRHAKDLKEILMLKIYDIIKIDIFDCKEFIIFLLSVDSGLHAYLYQ